VNNAGAGAWKHIEETTPEDAIGMMACPYQTTFACSSLFIPSMAKARTGHILNVTSAACSVGFRGSVGYASARWAVRGFSKLLYWDVKELGIGVTLLNAAEITGTDYFKDAPGKAGAASKARIPALFQLIDKLGINYDTTSVVAAALTAVERMERGECAMVLVAPNCGTQWLLPVVCRVSGQFGFRRQKRTKFECV